MADLVFNIAKGRVAELARRVENNDPTDCAFVIIAINAGTTTDGAFADFDTLTACLPGSGGAAEVTNTGYARKVLAAGTITITVDDSNDRVDVIVADQTWTSVEAGTAWTDLIFAFDSDTTAGTDTNIIPMTLHDFEVTPDGSDLTADVPAGGFFRAS